MKLLLPIRLESGLIRFAELEDIKSIYDLYTPYILNSAVSFETEVPEFDDFKKRIQGIMEHYPVLVFEDNSGEVKGYSYFSKYRERKAYQWCVESSIYISNEYFGTEVGVKLYSTLIDLAVEGGYTRMYGVIALPNERSEKFHQKLGFKKFAIFEKTGFKHGKWWDVVWYEKVLDDSGNPPIGS